VKGPEPRLEGRALGGQEVGMAKNWIKGAIKKPGALHKEMGIAEGKKIPEKRLKAASKESGKLGERARLAEKLKGFNK
jgi:hypothetical protein